MNGPVMVNGQPNPTGPGRYCPPRICWCGSCAWWKPVPPPNYAAAGGAATAAHAASWARREESTWIDAL